MRPYLRYMIWMVLALCAFLINLLSQHFPDQLLRLYSNTLNKWTIQGLSRLTGLVPFSIFEWLLYGLVSFLIGYISYSFVKCFKNRRSSLTILKWMLLNLTTGAAILYVLFSLLWGLNYNRPPLADELQLEVTEYSPEQLKALIRLLSERANTTREWVLEDENGHFTTGQHYSEIFARAPLGYIAIATDYPILAGNYGRPKAIFASPIMNYTFITGIYTPFTGEANINVATPETTLIFTTLHEMAHQRGIAHENDANFIAFLTSIAHPDVDFQYAGYFNALSYARSALNQIAPDKLAALNSLLSVGVINDLNYRTAFWQRYQGAVEEAMTQMNENYLRANGVAKGVQSYGLVVDLLLAYYQEELANYCD